MRSSNSALTASAKRAILSISQPGTQSRSGTSRAPSIALSLSAYVLPSCRLKSTVDAELGVDRVVVGVAGRARAASGPTTGVMAVAFLPPVPGSR